MTTSTFFDVITTPTFIDVLSQRFGRLVVMERSANTKEGLAQWVCQCDCGNTCIVRGRSLRKGLTQSCGCLHHEGFRAMVTTHGLRDLPEYGTWTGMRNRCNNPNEPKFKDYGARGIRVEWQSMEEFYRDMGPRPSPQHSIHRIDNDGNYCKDNCTWATAHEQANNKRNNRLITYQGETLTISQWAARLGMPRNRLKLRIQRGWPLDEALNPARYIPLKGKPKRQA